MALQMHRRRLVALASLVMLAGCGGGASTRTSASPAASASPPRSGCLSGSAARALPAGARDVRRASADVDGDERPDQLITYNMPPHPAQGHGLGDLRLRIVLATGQAADTELKGSVVYPTGAPDGAVGGYDLGGTGKQVAIVQVDESADGKFFDAFYAWSDCRILPLTDAAGQLLTVGAGGSVGTRAAWGCQQFAGGPVLVSDGLELDNAAGTLDISETDYRLQGTVFTSVGRRTWKVPIGDATAPPAMRALHCGPYGSLASAGSG